MFTCIVLSIFIALCVVRTSVTKSCISYKSVVLSILSITDFHAFTLPFCRHMLHVTHKIHKNSIKNALTFPLLVIYIMIDRYFVFWQINILCDWNIEKKNYTRLRKLRSIFFFIVRNFQKNLKN